MAKKDATELLKEIEEDDAKLFAEYEAKVKDLREKKLAAIIEPLKKERTTLAHTVNDANTRISEIDRELAKLTGVKPPKEKAAGGKRTRRTAAEMENEKKQLAAAGVELFKVLKKAKGEEMIVGDLSENPLLNGTPVKKALQGYIDAGLVGFRANGPRPYYKFIKDGEPKAAE